MKSSLARLTTALCAVLLVAAACGGNSTPSPKPATTPSGSVAAPTGTPAGATATAAVPTDAPPSVAPPSEAPPSDVPASGAPTASPAPTTLRVDPEVPEGAVLVRWFCCLGAGDAPEQVTDELAAIDAFNASHDTIKIAFEVVPYAAARDALATEIASGNAPDIVGPVGVGGANAFNDQWLDLQPLIDQTGYDMSQYQQGAVDFYKIGDVQTAIPFAIYPSVMFYQAGMFTEEIGLAEPPHKYGEKYVIQGEKAAALFGVAEGTEVDWTYDTVRKLGLLLTVDVNGKDATEAGFDPTQIVQYGFEPQRDDLRGLGAYFGPGKLAADDGTTVQIPDPWAAAWKYVYEGTWKDHFIMSGPTFESPEFQGGGYAFCSGKVAMQTNFLWSKYCLEGTADAPAPAGDNWNMAAVPVYQGDPSAAFNADTFRLVKTTKHPLEAFTAMTYLEGEASADLLNTYGGMSARPAEQEAFFAALDEGFQYPPLLTPPDWQVVKDSVQWADNPNFEAFMPKYNESLDILNTYLTKWTHTDGLDIDAEITALKDELQATWNQ
ncbi:MAG: multiple sugar transport system substrate-binding protein [Chloroflexota bacterium]|jgi:multiple sugar transport system substrate-binding protein|nr:multiple sugar transport system substrate-binding protein [Chloroflexota bacterium]